MWEAISSVLGGANGGRAMLLVLALVAVAVYMALSGRLSVNTGKIRIGAADGEREILRRQSEFLHVYCISREHELLRFGRAHGMETLEFGGYFAKYICERVYDKCMEWVLLNHVRDTPSYIALKQSEIWDLVLMLNPSEVFKTNEFRGELDGWVVVVVRRLLAIRNNYVTGGR